MGFTNKQLHFIEQYLIDWNATQAAIRAGYSPKTAYSIGQENLKKPEIDKAIKARIAEVSMSADEVLVRLAQQARGDLGEFSKVVNGTEPIDNHERSYLVKKLKHKKHITNYGEVFETVEIELHDSQAALVHLGRHHGLFTDKIDHNIGDVKITVKYQDEPDGSA